MIFVLQLRFALLEITSMSTLKYSHILIPALMLLSACGGGGDSCTASDGRPLDTTTDTSANCANTRAPSALSISYASVDAIEQLPDGGAGIYSLKGSILVTDQNGNAVADNTFVQLDVFDSLIARGTIVAGDTISGSLITDTTSPFQGDNATAAILSTVTVTRNSANITINAGDLVILNNAATSDRIRYVVSTTANSITVDAPYNNTYPSTLYPGAEYLVGQALIPASVLGTDPDDESLKTAGVSKTRDGVAAFRLEYPNNRLGYGNSNSYAGDTRELPFGSAQVWVVANAGGSVATANQTSFPGIAGGTMSFAPSTITANGDVAVTIVDANNNALAYVTIPAGAGTGGTGTSCVTNASGTCTSTVTVGVDGAITYAVGSLTADLTVDVP